MTAGAFQTQPGRTCVPNQIDPDCGDGFLAKVSATGALLYATYFGGNRQEAATGLAYASGGMVYLTGHTKSANLLTTPDAFQSAFQSQEGTNDLFIAKLDTTKAGAAGLIFSTYFGGNKEDIATRLSRSAGQLYLPGLTVSDPFPITADALYPNRFGRVSSFLLKISDPAVSAPPSPMPSPTPTPSPLPTPSPSATPSPARPLTNVSAASYNGNALAPASIVTAFGTGLALSTQAAVSPTGVLPTRLGGTLVTIRDRTGAEQAAGLFFVSPTQLNYYLPAETATGPATVTIKSSGGIVSSAVVRVESVAPGIFSADASGRGVAAGVVLRVKANGEQTFEPLVRFDPAQNRVVALPIDPGAANEEVFVIFFGTGCRYRSRTSSVSANLGGAGAEVTYAGEQGTLVGLDQINVRLPRSLAGRGEVDVVVTVDGKPANTIKVNVK